MNCEKCGGELHRHKVLKSFLHCSVCKLTVRVTETGEARKVSHETPTEAKVDIEPKTEKPKKPDFKVLIDYDDDGWRLVEYPNGQQWWEHKNPTIEPEENPETLSDYNEHGWRNMRSRATGETFQQHRDYQLPIRPYTLEQAIAFWKEKVSDEASAELLKYLCDPFGRDSLTYKQAWGSLSGDEKRSIKQRISEPDPPIVPPPIPNLSEGFDFPYTCGEINRRLRELGLSRSSDRAIGYAKSNGFPIKGNKVSFMDATDQQLLDLLESVKSWEKEVAAI